MKRYKKLIIGGIRSKIFALILFTVLLLSLAYMAVSLVHSNMLSKLVSESGDKQQSSIARTSSALMDQIVTQTLARSNRMEARLADEMFDAVRDRVAFLSDYATKLFAHPDDFEPQPYSGPDPKDDGVWTAKVIYVEGTDPADPAIASKVGLLSNMFDVMVSVCPSFGAATVYIALPEGVHISASDTSSSWFADGKPINYDPRRRGWYQQAVRAGGLIFTEGEKDAITGAYCIECAMPVYGPDGSLQAVVGADLFLDEMQKALEDSSLDGEYSLLINRKGRSVFDPQETAFPMLNTDRGGDLRKSQLNLLALVASDALQGSATGVVSGELRDGIYFITASPIKTTGWVLISAYSQETARLPAITLRERLSGIQEESQNTYHVKTKHFRTLALILLIVIMLLTLGNALLLGNRIVKPLNTITKRITELGGENLQFKMEDTYRTGDEVEQLAQSFASLSQKTLIYMDEVVNVTAEKERISTELSLATEIQAAMLPHIFPAFPDRPEFDIYASMDPAKEVGGDFYDYFLIDEDHLCLVMADVSGKGVPAALFMMASKIILQSVAMLGSTPAEILKKTNEALCTNNEAEMFVTVWIGILDITTGILTAANAGHEYPALRRPDGSFEYFHDRHGFVLGGFDDSTYTQYELKMEPGSKLFLYTDGVTEAMNAQRELFGTERLCAALNEQPGAAPLEILNNVRAAVNRFVKDAEQFDDLTMLCFSYTGQPLMKADEGKLDGFVSDS